VSKTKRIQVLMDPGEFDMLERVARKRGSSLSDLMRQAARAQYLVDIGISSRSRALESFLGLPDAAIADWASLKQEIEGRRGKDVY
jgi:hypothetical protein